MEDSGDSSCPSNELIPCVAEGESAYVSCEIVGVKLLQPLSPSLNHHPQKLPIIDFLSRPLIALTIPSQNRFNFVFQLPLRLDSQVRVLTRLPIHS
jgi:hypothetical protein